MTGIVGHNGLLLRASSSGPSDPYFANVSLLLHMDGANLGTSFPDSSLVVHSVTGAGALTSTTQVKFGSASGFFSNAYLSVSEDSSLDLTTGDFTIEGFVFCTTNTGSKIVMQRNDGGTGISQFYVDVNNLTPRFFAWNTSSALTASVSSSTALVLNTWNHLAVTRNGSSFNIWVNGASAGGATSASSLYLPSTPTTTIGKYLSGGSTQPFTGYMDEVRITKGVARYTSGFTPPASAFPNY